MKNVARYLLVTIIQNMPLTLMFTFTVSYAFQYLNNVQSRLLMTGYDYIMTKVSVYTPPTGPGALSSASSVNLLAGTGTTDLLASPLLQ